VKETIMSLEQNVLLLIAAKSAEEQARNKRIVLEEAVAYDIPGPDSGSKTATLEDGTKVTVKRGWNYKADCQAIEDKLAWDSYHMPAPIKSKTTRELDEKGYEWYKHNRPAIYEEVSKFVTVAPKKVAVEVKKK